MNSAFAKYATLAVPRYTSYPTAPQFGTAITHENCADWYRALDRDEPVSLYLHVPYCRQLCWYCGCNMKLVTRNSVLTEYARAMEHELRLLAQHLPARMKISHLHWGGGTPTSLEADDLESVMNTVRELFDVLPDAELAIESDPRTLTAQTAERIGQLGFTRASFGVQEFDAEVQKAINRIQPAEMVENAVALLRSSGVSGINFDLIYGLPQQTVESLVKTVEICIEMRPDRIALFGYAHVPWFAKKQRLINEAALPGVEARRQQASAASGHLVTHGYEAIGLDHFARPEDTLAIASRNGELMRNFQGYTTDKAQTLLGIGATSIGKTPFGYFQNIPEPGAWLRAVQSGQLPVARGVELKGEDKLRGSVINQLMCNGTVDLHDAAISHGFDPDWVCQFEPAIDELCADGLIKVRGSRIRVTETGAKLVRVIASVFDEYYVGNTGSHAIAV